MSDLNTSQFHIPIELMKLFHEIKDDIGEVKERMVRLEAQQHNVSIQGLRDDLALERNHRIQLQLDVVKMKTKVAPLIAAASMVGGAILSYIVKVYS